MQAVRGHVGDQSSTEGCFRENWLNEVVQWRTLALLRAEIPAASGFAPGLPVAIRAWLPMSVLEL